jgi:hypothetical protein
MAMIECCSNHQRKRFLWKTRLLRSQIDAILKKYDDWRGEMLSRLRALIKQADPAFVEEVKWKKPGSSPRESPCGLMMEYSAFAIPSRTP